MNIRKDKEESADQLLKICQHLRPDAYFKPEPDAVSTDFLADIVTKLGRELTPEEKLALNVPEEEPSEDEDVDTIVRA